MSVEQILVLPRRFYFAARSLLFTGQYFAGLMRGPKLLYMELTNTCNADCIFCAYRHDKREKTLLGLDAIKRMATEFKKLGGRSIGLSPTLGETFVDRDAVKKIQAVDRIGFNSIHTFSNASLMHKFGVENILRSGLTELRISLPPMDEAVYSRMYQNKNYTKVRANLRDLLIAFARITDKTVQNLYIEFRADRPLDECRALPDFQEYIAPHLGPGVHLSAMTSFDSWDGAITQADMLPGMTLLDGTAKGAKRIPCGRMFILQVRSDGTIRQCGCRVDTAAPKDELTIGHMDDMTLEQAFHSPKARDNVASFVRGKHLQICHNCSWYSPAV
jgi:radical SAM family protein/iron-sulfur cluster protein